MAKPILRPAGAPKPRVPLLQMRVWDAPTRLFHWAIVLLVATSYISIKYDYAEVHLLSGYTLLTLLLFRLVWGFVGSETSRFRKFLRSPLEAVTHLIQFPRREPDREIGHNAAGGWMVLLMLLVLGVQVGTGLFAGHPVYGGGPFVGRISEATRHLVNRIHTNININILLTLIGLHVVAVFAYAIVKRHDLVRPMVTGKKRLPATARQPRFVSPVLAGAILVVAAVFVFVLVRFV